MGSRELAAGLAPGQQQAARLALRCMRLVASACSTLLLHSKAAACAGPARRQQLADTCFQHVSSHMRWLVDSAAQQLGQRADAAGHDTGASGSQQAAGSCRSLQLLLALQGWQQTCSLVQQLLRVHRALDCQPLQPLLLQLLQTLCAQTLQQAQQQPGPGSRLGHIQLADTGINLPGLLLWLNGQMAQLPGSMRQVLATGLVGLVEQQLAAAGMADLADEVLEEAGVL